MRIGICDDDALALEWIGQKIDAYRKCEGKVLEIFPFQTEEELKSFLEKELLDLIFMDIDMGDGRNGIEIASELTKCHPVCNIAFLTNYLEYAPDVYETRHCYYILKSEFEKRLPFVIRKAEEKSANLSAKISLALKGGKRELIEKCRIMYAERSGRRTCIFLDDGTVLDTAERLEPLYERLGNGEFVRCHNSFVVRLEKVHKYSRLKLILENGQVISISRPYIDSVKKAFVEWSWRSAGGE